LSITIDDVKSKLLTLDQIRESLASTEPLATYEFEVGGNQVAFKLEEDFAHGLKAKRPEEPVNGFVTISGTELQLTAGSLVEFAAEAFMSKGYLYHYPADIVADSLNHQFTSGRSGDAYKVLGIGQRKAGTLTRGALQPYSNLQLLDIALEGISRKYGSGEVYGDYKFIHNLKQTHVRLIVPENVRVIERTGTDSDTWSVGVQLKNSLNGDEQTEIHGYLFRYWCTNGAVDTLNSANSVWSRRGEKGRSDAVYEWAKDAVDDVLGGLEDALDRVQGMVDIPVEGEVMDTLRSLFTTYRVPGGIQRPILAAMAEDRNLTMYSVMQAVTQAANNADMNPAHVNMLMEVGGDIPNIATHRCDNCHQFVPGHTH
jgi:hypothetical protein